MTFRRIIPGLFIIVLSVIIDQLSKLAVERYLPFQQVVEVMPFAALYRTWNDGIAFSFLAGFGSLALVGIAAIVVIVVFWLWLSSPANRPWLNLGYALIIGGAIGNIIDRASYGHVVDFILLYYGDWSFAIFNIADAFISIGVTLIILDEISIYLKQKRLS